MRDKGKLISWNDDKGYGFIAPFSGAAQVFIHVKAFGNRSRRPKINDIVTYTVSSDKQGRPRAANAVLAGTRPPPRAERMSSTPAILVASIFLMLVGTAVFALNLPLTILLIYLADSTYKGPLCQDGNRRSELKSG